MNCCFIIMPFDPQYDTMVEQILKPAAEACGFRPSRGDDLFSNATILSDIWSSIQSAEVMIAVLTGNNANVFYELGLAHAKGKAVVLVADKAQVSDQVPKRDRLPADLWGVRVVTYDRDNPFWGERLKTDVIATLNAVKDDPNKAIPDTFVRKP